MVNRWVVMLAVAAAPMLAQAQRGLVIGGAVYDDRPALALRASFAPIAGVSVNLYRDDGDGVAGASDALIDSAKTNAAGVYAFRGMRAGNYWIAVDSRSIAGGWPEQTFGPAGSLCARPDGTSVTIHFEGTCFGGRSLASDDASALATSEHVAGIALREDLTNVDFAFSFDAVTSTNDGQRVQGSFRQFIVNANALPGPNRMRFVPVARAPEQRETIMGVPPRWWSIVLGSALPALRDEDTVIDGTAHNFLAPSSITNIHPGRVGEKPTVTVEERTHAQERPELEIVATGAEGIVCESRCGIRAIATHGAPLMIALRADARLEHLMIGASPDADPANRGTFGLQIERGTTVAQYLLVSSQSNVGIVVGPGARLDAEHIEVTRCGEPLSGAAILLLSNNSTIRTSTVSANPGAGIVIGALDGSRPAHGNTIDGCTISSNQAGVVLSPGATRNVIARNDIMWNRLGGVTVAPSQTTNTPAENRLTANRFDENGMRPIVLDLTAEPDVLARATRPCEQIASTANGGMAPPVIDSARLLTDAGGHRIVIRGRACPGQTVEVYQSFVTSAVRDEVAELPRIREEKSRRAETMSNDRRTFALPSIGEFNYLGAMSTAADGTFEATFPFSVVTPARREESSDLDNHIWASEVLTGADPSERAFSAIAIDARGNTSEMSVRRQVDAAQNVEK